MIPSLGSVLHSAYRFPSVQAYLKRDEYGHLMRRDGTVYMYRYAVVRVGTLASKLLKLVTWGKYDHIRLHGIMQADGDRELHNHPFNYRTFILDGWYKEERELADMKPPSTKVYVAGDTSVMGLKGYHRISAVPAYGVWTLFCMGKDHGEWGFLVGRKHVTSKEFFKLRHIRANGVQE